MLLTPQERRHAAAGDRIDTIMHAMNCRLSSAGSCLISSLNPAQPSPGPVDQFSGDNSLCLGLSPSDFVQEGPLHPPRPGAPSIAYEPGSWPPENGCPPAASTRDAGWRVAGPIQATVGSEDRRAGVGDPGDGGGGPRGAGDRGGVGSDDRRDRRDPPRFDIGVIIGRRFPGWHSSK